MERNINVNSQNQIFHEWTTYFLSPILKLVTSTTHTYSYFLVALPLHYFALQALLLQFYGIFLFAAHCVTILFIRFLEKQVHVMQGVNKEASDIPI